MPRTARAIVGGYCYHVLNRGNGRQEVFHHDGDYANFCRLLRQGCARMPMRLLGYCLMPNHFHLAVWPGASTTHSFLRGKRKMGAAGILVVELCCGSGFDLAQ
ncbi:MAG TPA: transposase [Gemmataceae bacterium]|nr:transposase [Gemmataceae bacterium]